MLHSLQTLLAPALLEWLTLVINHVLAAESVATDKLRAHAGRTVSLALNQWPALLPTPPLLAWRVTPAGLLRRQAVSLLDTSAGSFERVASSWDAFRELMAAPSEDVADWFKLSLVVALRDAGLSLAMGQCYSAIHPLALGGPIGIDNFEQCSWRLHVGLMGQIHQQLRNVPAGTRVTSISVK